MAQTIIEKDFDFTAAPNCSCLLYRHMPNWCIATGYEMTCPNLDGPKLVPWYSTGRYNGISTQSFQTIYVPVT